jgi:hypothetical protein
VHGLRAPLRRAPSIAGWLAIVDEFTRDYVAFDMFRSMTSVDVLETPVGVLKPRGDGSLCGMREIMCLM